MQSFTNINKDAMRAPLQRGAVPTRSQLVMSSTGITYIKVTEQRPNKILLNHLRKETETDVHKISIKDLCHRYNTDPDKGLTSIRADELLVLHGPNCLTPPKQKTRCQLLLHNLFSGFALLIWIAIVLTTVSVTIQIAKNGYHPEYKDEIYMGSILTCVVIFTALFAFYQEDKSRKIMDCFKKMMAAHTIVIRDGTARTIITDEVVIGDLVELQLGSKIPADVRITEASNMKVDNSSLTGESDPQPRTHKQTSPEMLETENLAFATTAVVEGNGRGIVFATGDETYIGKIAGLTSCLQAETTPLRKEIDRFVKIISIISIAISFILMAVHFWVSKKFLESFIFFIAILIANIPEGLLVTLTACLTLTAKILAKKNCLVKSLDSIETLGSTSVICSDKTGTITQNKMTVMDIWFNDNIVPCDTDNAPLAGLPFIPNDNDAFLLLVQTAALCTVAEFYAVQGNVIIQNRAVKGDATESAILKFLTRAMGESFVIKYRTENAKVFNVAFSSATKFALSIHLSHDRKHYICALKGAPEIIIEFCTTIQIGNEAVALNGAINYKQRIRRIVTELALRGERVVAIASKHLSTSEFPIPYKWHNENVPRKDFNLCGLLALMDPPRNSVAEAVHRCHTAGIKVVMVTGDHPATAVAISRKVGIISPESITIFDLAAKMKKSVSELRDQMHQCTAIVITGSELREMPNSQLREVFQLHSEIVFARTSPQQKLMIVEAAQTTGAIVAVTGDGVNDAPAMKRADIGIAMGITGTEVAKEAANMVLLDDNFASIINGIEQGRLVFDNFKKSIFFILTSSTPEMLPFLAYVVFGIPLPLNVIAIICVDFITDLWPGISLAYERSEQDIMKRPPRDPKFDRLISDRMILMTYFQIGLIQAFAGFANYFIIYAAHGFYPKDLYMIRSSWESTTNNGLKDGNGEEWTYQERRDMEHRGITAYFVAILETQLADLMICRTRRISMFQQGISNWALNVGFVGEIVISLLLIYTPASEVFSFRPISWIYWIPPLPFCVLILCYDEIRKLIIRHNPTGFMARNTYY